MRMGYGKLEVIKTLKKNIMNCVHNKKEKDGVLRVFKENGCEKIN